MYTLDKYNRISRLSPLGDFGSEYHRHGIVVSSRTLFPNDHKTVRKMPFCGTSGGYFEQEGRKPEALL